MNNLDGENTEQINIFDIETTGLTGSDEIVCFTFGGIQMAQDIVMYERELLMELATVVADLEKDIIVTFNGEPRSNSRPGFDIPLLRTRYLVNGIPDEYPFRGLRHLDLSDVLNKYFNTRHQLPPKIEHLLAAQVTELVNICGLFPLKTKDQNVQQLKSNDLEPQQKTQIFNYVSRNTEPKFSEGNSLDTAFSLLCPDANESLLHEEFSGEDVPVLFEKFKESGDGAYMDAILEHNKNCAIKTRMLYDKLITSKLVSVFGIPLSRL